MWLRRSRCEVLRVGARSVERWGRLERGARVLVGEQLLMERSVQGLCRAVSAVLLAPKAAGRLVLVLESAWLPVMLLPLSKDTFKTGVVERHLRFRLDQLYGAAEPRAGWDVRVDFSPGQRFALGYGLAVDLRASLERVAEQGGVRWASLEPALAWGFGHWPPPRTAHWRVHVEQDRVHALALERGAPCYHNPAAQLPGDEGWERLLGVEALRAGQQAPGRIQVVQWEAPVAPSAPAAKSTSISSVARAPSAQTVIAGRVA